MKRHESVKLLTRMISFAGVFTIAGIAVAFGQDAVAAASGATTEMDVIKWIGISSGFGLGLAAIGCGLGQGKLVASALDGIARNPESSDKMLTPMILGLAFIEALTIYALVFGFVFKLLVLGG